LQPTNNYSEKANYATATALYIHCLNIVFLVHCYNIIVILSPFSCVVLLILQITVADASIN